MELRIRIEREGTTLTVNGIECRLVGDNLNPVYMLLDLAAARSRRLFDQEKNKLDLQQTHPKQD